MYPAEHVQRSGPVQLPCSEQELQTGCEHTGPLHPCPIFRTSASCRVEHILCDIDTRRVGHSHHVPMARDKLESCTACRSSRHRTCTDFLLCSCHDHNGSHTLRLHAQRSNPPESLLICSPGGTEQVCPVKPCVHWHTLLPTHSPKIEHGGSHRGVCVDWRRHHEHLKHTQHAHLLGFQG